MLLILGIFSLHLSICFAKFSKMEFEIVGDDPAVQVELQDSIKSSTDMDLCENVEHRIPDTTLTSDQFHTKIDDESINITEELVNENTDLISHSGNEDIKLCTINSVSANNSNYLSQQTNDDCANAENTTETLDEIITIDESDAVVFKHNNVQTEIQDDISNIENTNTENQEYLANVENYFCDAIIELSRLSALKDGEQNYFRGCKWSPDGTCILSVINNQGMQVSELPHDLYSNESVSSERPVDLLNPVIRVNEAGCVYDFSWYPKMNSYDPATCCWVSSMQHGPVQLWDAFDGKLRCSYRGYNEVDEVEAALSVCFSSGGDHIYAGYKKTLKLFNTDRPGRDYTKFRLKYPATCMALNPIGNILAIGSWARTITLMSADNGELSELSILSGHKGGVTHLVFMNNGNYLISGARKDPLLQCWDIRYCCKPVKTFCRISNSNQRIYFDVSPYDTWLATANTNGIIKAWDMRTFGESDVKEINFPVHNDCCNGLSIHPKRPIIATSSGQHHFLPDEENDEQTITKEDSLVFWWMGPIITENEDM